MDDVWIFGHSVSLVNGARGIDAPMNLARYALNEREFRSQVADSQG
jgi:hypothetical protein